ncbi:hypothetical protein MN116_004204 [Schistosoma mekongi]|uniref:Glutamyl-tRNA(Gln) amidotransferase subunit C, mitochondrial n=1 Tax=Schistosoma mekongi TaxID=38744 RepID=A0AAE1ZG04_SCHME|nr:hypothetical protein MN116_004204 [Schistosoma mekongi]
MIFKHCALITQTLSQCRYCQFAHNTIGKKQIHCSSTESSKNTLSNTVIDEGCTNEETQCLKKNSVYRYVPSRPIWKRFDVGLQDEVNNESKGKDFLSIEQGIFYIGRNSLPKRTHLDLDTVKLLEQVSLIDFKEENLKILEEAIRYADSLLTKEAFQGTTNNHYWSPDSTEPMISLCDEINPDLINCFVDSEDSGSLNDCNLASDIMRHVPNTWEGYIVAPLGNAPAEQK